MGRLLAALRGDSPPYIVTLLLAALAWYVTHLVDRARETPLVEASIAVAAAATGPGGERHATLEIENLSDRLFRAVGFELLMSDAGGAITGFEKPIAYAPAVPMTEAPELANGGMSFTLPYLQPENRLSLSFRYTGGGTPRLVVAQSASAILVTPPSCTTFFVRHEALVLLGLIAAFAAATAALILLAPAEPEYDT